MRRRLAGLLTLGMSCALALGAAGDEPPRLVYQLPERADAEVREDAIPAWTEGAIVYAAVDGVALRASDSGQAPKLRSLAAGTKVRVIRGDARLGREAGFVHRWVAVEVEETRERGHVFGGFLTPFVIVADLDGDGRPEVATVGFTPEAQVVVRIGSPGRPTSSVSWRVEGEGFLSQRGGLVRAGLVPASEAGIALLRVFTGQEACASNGTAFISFVATSREPDPRPRVALETHGLVDPPNIATVNEVFHASSRTVEVHTSLTTEDEAGNEVTEPEHVERYRLRDGVYELSRER